MNNRGYITLVSVIIISVVLLLAVGALGERSILGRFMLLDINRKIESEKLAEACVQVAIIAVVNNPLYNPALPVLVTVDPDSNPCSIHSVTPSSPLTPTESEIITTASSTGATTNLRVIWDISGEEISLWQELKSI